MNNKINRLHEKSLWIAFNNKTSSFADSLAKDGSVTIHKRNLQVLATEIHKSMSMELMQGLFCAMQTHYNMSNPLLVNSV